MKSQTIKNIEFSVLSQYNFKHHDDIFYHNLYKKLILQMYDIYGLIILLNNMNTTPCTPYNTDIYCLQAAQTVQTAQIAQTKSVEKCIKNDRIIFLKTPKFYCDNHSYMRSYTEEQISNI